MANNPTNDVSKMAQVVTQMGGGNQSPEMQELARLLAKRLRKEIATEEEAEATHEAARKANAEHMVRVHEEEKRKQDGCPHIKPRGQGTALAGQKTHRGWITYVCQYCGKQFSDPPQREGEKVPPHLYPDGNMVGGPH
jgi:rubrerythrin